MTRKRNIQRRAELDLAEVVEATQVDVKTSEDFRQVRRALELLLARDVLGPFKVDTRRLIRQIKALSVGTIKAWQGAAQFQMYAAVLDKEGTIPRSGDGPAIELTRARLSPRVGPDGAFRIWIVGPLQEALTLQLSGLLHASGAQRLMRCECDRLFVKTGRREFCSDRCQKRVYMRVLRSTPKKGAADATTSRKG